MTASMFRAVAMRGVPPSLHEFLREPAIRSARTPRIGRLLAGERVVHIAGC